MCDFNSLNYTCLSWSRWLPPFLWNLETDISDPFEDYGAEGNILRYKGERSFLRNFFVICEFISQNCSFLLRKPFAKTVLVEFAKWYLGAHWGLRWKGNSLRCTLERSFVRNCIALCECTSQSYTFPWWVWQDRFLEIRNGRLLGATQLTVTKEVSLDKNDRSFLRNCFQIRDFIWPSYITVSWSRFPALFMWIPRTDISDGFGECGEKGIILREKAGCSFLRNSFVTCEFISKAFTTLGSTRRDMVRKERSSDKNWKEAFGETALWHVNATPRLPRNFSLTRLLTLFDCSLHWAISQRNEAYGDPGNIVNENWKEALWETSQWNVNSSHRVPT